MADQSIIIAASVVAGAILLNGMINHGTGQRYEVAAGPDNTAWRIDTKNGRISMCGTLAAGSAFSQLALTHEKDLLAAGAKPSATDTSKIFQEGENNEAVSRPRCTDWAPSDD